MTEDDRLIRETPLYYQGECTAIHKNCIITKEEFLECFNEWVVIPSLKNPISIQTEFYLPVDNNDETPV